MKFLDLFTYPLSLTLMPLSFVCPFEILYQQRACGGRTCRSMLEILLPRSFVLHDVLAVVLAFLFSRIRVSLGEKEFATFVFTDMVLSKLLVTNILTSPTVLSRKLKILNTTFIPTT